MYRVDRRENTLESRSTDNEASLVRSDSGTGVETHSSLAATTSSFPSLSSFFCFSLRSSFFLPTQLSRTFSRARMAVINRARVAGIRGVQRATCCCLYISTKKKASDDHSHLRPCFNFVVFYPFLRPLVGRLELLLLVADLCFLTFKSPVERVICNREA